MTQTPEGFGNDVVALVPRDLHPLVVKRIALCALLGEIQADLERYNSQEWFDIVAAISDATAVIRQHEKVENKRRRETGIADDYSITRAYHSSSSFPMRSNPAAKVIHERDNGPGLANALPNIAEAA
jgi:hypothetical protein